MSRELVFYPAFRDKATGKYQPILFDVSGEPASVFWRSGSFIEMDFFTQDLSMIDREEFHDSCKEFFGNRYENLNEDGAFTYVYRLSEETMDKVGASGGIVSGYALLEDIREYYASECQQEYLCWNMGEILPAEVYAEMPPKEQEKHGRFAAIDRYSKEYVCSVLSEVLDDIPVPYEWEGEVCMLVVYSF